MDNYSIFPILHYEAIFVIGKLWETTNQLSLA